MLAVAASLALLLGGAIQQLVSQHTGQNRPALPTDAAADMRIDDSTAGLANLLLEIQGLNEDDFFRTEEAESLWL